MLICDFLLFWAKPQKPRINGNLTTLVDTYLELTCISNSISAPDYYSKLLTLSYTWFVNNTKVDENSRSTRIFKVTRGHQYNRYSCTATEEDLESYRSDVVQINPLCKLYFYNCNFIYILLYDNLKVVVSQYSSLLSFYSSLSCF